MLRIVRIGILFGLCLLVAQVPVRAQDNVPRFEDDRCPFKKPEGVDVDCGWLITRETHADDNSPEIRLAMAIFHSTSRDPQPDPLIYLDGGSGGPSLDGSGANWSGSTFEVYSQDRDVILLDQRVVGFSE